MPGLLLLPFLKNDLRTEMEGKSMRLRESNKQIVWDFLQRAVLKLRWILFRVPLAFVILNLSPSSKENSVGWEN